MFKAKAITAVIVTGIFGLAACGGGSGDKDDSTVTTIRQKNAALPLPGKKPLPQLPMLTTVAPGTTAPAVGPTTTAVNVTTTSISRKFLTPLPQLPTGR